ncbi:MAG: SDR family NAD(P)-dependent oxidoreductase [Pseudomonadota bacterium]
MTDAQRSLFCFGLGYSALYLCQRLKAKGWRLGGTVRSAEKAEALAAAGIHTQVWPGSDPKPPPGSDWLISVPPGEAGCPAFLAAGALADTARSVTYLSTTGVYGDLSGGWAFEWSPARPQSARAAARLRAEDQWTGTGHPHASLVRLPGIYGPGRSALDRLRAGTARNIVKPGQVFSRIHVADIASGLECLLDKPGSRGVFNLTDDLPGPPEDVTAYAARLLGVAPPEEIDHRAAGLSPMAASFFAECKRVSNARAKSALGWRPKFPTFKEGLQAILEAEGGPVDPLIALAQGRQ